MAMYAAIGGMALQALGTVTNGLSQASQQDAAADADQFNADVSTQESKAAFAQGVEREGMQRRNAGQQLGAQRAAIAESGFDPSSGSALEVQQQSVQNAELDALQTRYQGILQGARYEGQAAIDQYQTNAAKAAARSSKVGAYLSLAGKALSSYGNYAGGAGSAAGAGSSAGAGAAAGSNSWGFSMPTSGG